MQAPTDSRYSNKTSGTGFYLTRGKSGVEGVTAIGRQEGEPLPSRFTIQRPITRSQFLFTSIKLVEPPASNQERYLSLVGLGESNIEYGLALVNSTSMPKTTSFKQIQSQIWYPGVSEATANGRIPLRIRKDKNGVISLAQASIMNTDPTVVKALRQIDSHTGTLVYHRKLNILHLPRRKYTVWESNANGKVANAAKTESSHAFELFLEPRK